MAGVALRHVPDTKCGNCRDCYMETVGVGQSNEKPVNEASTKRLQFT